MAKVTVRKLKAGAWNGFDFGGERLELSGQGATCAMSEKRALMLMSDFPGGFEVAGALPAGSEGQEQGETGPTPAALQAEKPKRRKRGQR